MSFIGIDVGGTNLVVGIVDKVNGEYKVRKNIAKGPTNAPCSMQQLCDSLENLIKNLLSKENMTLDDIESIGICTPGSVDSKNGIIGFSCNLGANNWKISEELGNRLGKKVAVLNDADSYAYGEFASGAIKGCDNALVFTLGTGVGLGIILNGKLYSSNNFAAGEVGHMVIKFGGRQCNCGRKGCFETYASATGLINTTIEEVKKQPDMKNQYIYKITDGLKNVVGKTAFDAKDQGDKLACEIIDIYVKQLACGITNLVNIFQPDKICIGGGISLQGEKLLAPLREYINEEKYKTVPFVGVDLVAAKNCDTSAIIGAVAFSENN